MPRCVSIHIDLAKGTDLLVIDVTARPETPLPTREEVEREVDLLHGRSERVRVGERLR